MREIVEIVKQGSAGDGVAADGLFVPYTVPGDIARVTREGARGCLEEIITPGQSRTNPACRHFGRCGGCALQMLERDTYLAWKRDLVVTALKQRGFEHPPVEDIRAVAPGTRRRASFKAKRVKDGVRLGFYEPGSRDLVDLDECPVLLPQLAQTMPLLRTHLAPVLNPGDTAELFVTAADNGIDLSLKLQRPRGPDILMALAEMASALKLARLLWNGEAVAIADPPNLRIGKVRVALPPDSFLQPTREGERILQDLVRGETGEASQSADLFSGCGTFTFVLAETSAVHAADGDRAHIVALAEAAKRSGANVASETRDLFRRPLTPEEVSRFELVLLDPPRIGASAQTLALARSQTRRILYVSCNPASFARDARVLADGGYTLTRVVPLDQFLWSPHVELFAVFSRS
jgi:23S rRNA (uracil1939-C5)-methyltransferase